MLLCCAGPGINEPASCAGALPIKGFLEWMAPTPTVSVPLEPMGGARRDGRGVAPAELPPMGISSGALSNRPLRRTASVPALPTEKLSRVRREGSYI
jgi:hypothetical protein